MFVPVASTLTITHRDRLFLASFTQQPEIQHVVSQGQIIFTDRLPVTNGQTTIISYI